MVNARDRHGAPVAADELERGTHMGQLFYGNSDDSIVLPDRLLAHLKVIATTKLRRGESFTLTWTHPHGEPAGRSAIWLQASIPLRFVFDSPEPERLDPALLQKYANGAMSSGGLVLDAADVGDGAEASADSLVLSA